MKNCLQIYGKNYQQGFTLIELIVVVAILAVIAGAVISSVSINTQNDSTNDAAKFEMEQIRQALLKFKRDNQQFPVQTSAADTSFLFDKGGLDNWNPDYKTGWRGSYLSGGDSGIVDIGDNLQLNGNGLPHQIDTAPHILQRSVPDPFASLSVFNGQSIANSSNPCVETAANDQCLLDWRLIGQTSLDRPIEKYGRPYLFFDLNDSQKARIVSMGKNGVYESSAVTKCQNKFAEIGDNDDLILCLF